MKACMKLFQMVPKFGLSCVGRLGPFATRYVAKLIIGLKSLKFDGYISFLVLSP